MDLTAANRRLRDAGIKVTLLQRKNWLYLRVVLPPKPNSNKTKPFRQEITRPKAGLPATPQGVKAAEKLAISLWGSVIDGSFEWDTWLGKTAREHRPIKEWISEFREYWLGKGKTSEQTWDLNWYHVLKRLPQEQPLTSDVLLTTLLQIDPSKQQRNRAATYFQRLAEFAEIPIDLRPHKGTYCEGKSETPRDLPDDDLIEEWWSKISYAPNQWLYGAIAAFGLRPHEAFFIEPTADPLTWEVRDGKTGGRHVSALYPEWVKRWDLANGSPPNLSYSTFRRYGMHIAQFFIRYDIPFVAYDLRHAYAVRGIKFNIPVSIAAKMMGHSVAVHTKTYHRWLSAAEQQAAYHRAIANGPKAPSASRAES